jgi:poly-gamma-glutamate capsule biosynthesis protein CapA/YwtB (metallophosphatase superfamily)
VVDPRRHRTTRGRSERLAVFVSVSLVALVAVAIAGTYLYRQHVSAKAHSVYITPEASDDCGPIVDDYIKGYPQSGLTRSRTPDAGMILSHTREQGRPAVEVSALPAITMSSGTRCAVLRPEKRYWLMCDSGDSTAEHLARYIDEYQKVASTVTLTAVGDIIPGRTVAKMMELLGVSYPFQAIAPVVNGADITYGDLEAPLSDRVKPPHTGTAFIAPTYTVQGLKMLGLDIVSLANNHSTNFGAGAFTDTLALLKNNGIKYAGGGHDLTEARSPAVLEAGGLRFAFLDYNSIIGSQNATATAPGVAWIRMKPWSRDSQEDMEMVRQSIRQARSGADVVVACFHWSEEYRHTPSASQRAMAHAACDAGADLVIGSHPHCVQSMEMYGGKLIAYSLGNFIFDQMEHDYSREGVVMRCRFRGSRLMGLELVPYVIRDWCQPVAVSGAQAQKIMDELLTFSGY